MLRFYLHVCNEARAPDNEGIELPDLDAARVSAIQGAREMIAEEILSGRPVSRRHCIEITDADGEILHTVLFGDVVQLRT